jgi:2-methylisocitrate lyase-like PEP mutase family enzyme
LIYPSEELDIPGEEMGSGKAAQTDRRMTAVEKLRSMLADSEKFIACPGVYDGFTARIALREGVDCLYMVSLT